MSAPETHRLTSTGTGTSDRFASRTGWAVPVIAVAQLMVTFDNSIVNIALPTAQAELGFNDGQRAWVVTAYAVAFGSLLLLGGRLCDIIGRKRAFLIGLAGFAAASILGGLAPSFAVLVAARALQGVFGALLAPAALALLTTMFPSGRERARAFGVFAAIGVSGSSIGMLLGGALTEYLDWRWCMYVNVVFASVAFVGGILTLSPGRSAKRPRLDVPGTLTVAGGSFGVVYGLSVAESEGWTSPVVIGSLAVGALLFAIFVLIQQRVRSPLLPLRVVLHRARGGALITAFVAVIGLFGVSLFLTYVMQQQLGFSPFMTGVGFLPMVLAIMTAATSVPSLFLNRVGQRWLTTTGLLAGAGALFWFSRLDIDSTYLGDVLGPLVLLGLGIGTAVSTSINTATAGTLPEDAGVASAAINAVQQVGGSVGLALLATIAATAAGTHEPVSDAAAIHGYATAFAVACAIFVTTAAVVIFLIPARRMPVESLHPQL